MDNTDFTSIGNIIKSKGVLGELVVNPTVDFPDKLPTISLFYVENDRGDLVPYRVESAKLEHKRGRATFFVKFDRVSNRDQAEALRGQDLYIEAEFADDFFDEDDPALVVGYTVLDSNGIAKGEVLDVFENPAHWLMQVKLGATTILVPYVDAYVTEIDDDAQTITVDGLDELAGI